MTTETNNVLFEEEFLEMLDTPPLREYVYWQNLKNRKIILNEDVSDQLVEKIIMQIERFNEMDKFMPVEDRVPIKLFINSNGGDVGLGLVICDVIKNSKTPIIGIVLGYSYSMGTLILMACHERLGYEHSSYLIHDGSFGISGSAKKARDTIKFYDSMGDKIKNYILKHTKIDEKVFDEKFNSGTEWYMWSDEALELGVIDRIIGVE